MTVTSTTSSTLTLGLGDSNVDVDGWRVRILDVYDNQWIKVSILRFTIFLFTEEKYCVIALISYLWLILLLSFDMFYNVIFLLDVKEKKTF